MQFIYLGSLVAEDGWCSKEVKRRTAIGKETFSNRTGCLQLLEIYWNLISLLEILEIS